MQNQTLKMGGLRKFSKMFELYFRFCLHQILTTKLHHSNFHNKLVSNKLFYCVGEELKFERIMEVLLNFLVSEPKNINQVANAQSRKIASALNSSIMFLQKRVKIRDLKIARIWKSSRQNITTLIWISECRLKKYCLVFGRVIELSYTKDLCSQNEGTSQQQMRNLE